jgi:hypothetical protein
MGFFVGRIAMAVQYAFFKEVFKSKSTSNQNNVFK